MSTVPHLAGQSRIFTRCPASRKMRQMSRIFSKWYYFLRCRLFYIVALERNKETNKARFILRTPTDAVYISRVAAITSDCLFFTRRQHQHCYRDVPWVVDSHWIIASVLRITCARCFPYSRDMRWRNPL